MYKGSISTPTAVTAGTNVPLNLSFNTNTNILATGGVISILKPGLYEINVTATAVGPDESVSMSLLNNGNVIPEDVSTAVPAAATDASRFVINDTLRVVNMLASTVRLSVQFTDDVTVNNMVVTVKRIR